MKKMLMLALFSAGLAAGCGDEDGLSPGAREDAAADTGNLDVGVKLDTSKPQDATVDSPVVDAPTPPPPDAGVDGSPGDTAPPDALPQDAQGDTLLGDALTDVL